MSLVKRVVITGRGVQRSKSINIATGDIVLVSKCMYLGFARKLLGSSRRRSRTVDIVAAVSNVPTLVLQYKDSLYLFSVFCISFF